MTVQERREALRSRCEHGALRAREAEPFAGPMFRCACCRSWFGSLRVETLCSACRAET